MAATFAHPSPLDLDGAVSVLTHSGRGGGGARDEGGGRAGKAVAAAAAAIQADAAGAAAPAGASEDGDPLGPLLLPPQQHAPTPFSDPSCAREREGPAPIAAYAAPAFLADAAARLALARAVAAAAAAAATAKTASGQPAVVTVPFLLLRCVGPGRPLPEGEPVEVRRACRRGREQEDEEEGAEGSGGAAAGDRPPCHQVLLRGSLAATGGIACSCTLCARAPGLALPPSAFLAHAYGEAEAAAARAAAAAATPDGGGGGGSSVRVRPPPLPAAAQIFLPRVGPSGASLEEIVALANAQQVPAIAGAAAGAAVAPPPPRCAFCSAAGEGLRVCRSCGAAMHSRCCGWVMLHAGGRSKEAAERGAPCPLCLAAAAAARQGG